LNEVAEAASVACSGNGGDTEGAWRVAASGHGAPLKSIHDAEQPNDSERRTTGQNDSNGHSDEKP
jgi:hypothetical protein